MQGGQKEARAKNKPAHGRISAIPLLFIACSFFASMIRMPADGKTDSLYIDYAAAVPASDNPRRIEFYGEYVSSLENEIYKIYVCKSKKFDEANAYCYDGYWCESSEYSTENPLKCGHEANGEKKGSNSFFMFICSSGKICSPYFSGRFVFQENLLNILAPSRVDFNPMQFSFEGRENADNELGKITVTSSNLKNSGWSVNVSAQDWESEKGERMDYDGNGETSGRLKIDMDSARIESSSSLSGISMGKTDSFSPSIKNINIVTASKKSEGGIFDIEGINFDQFIPAGQKEGIYTTVLTFTIS